MEYRESRSPVGLGISRYGDTPNNADLLDRDMDRHTSSLFVYFVNVDVGQLHHAAVMDMSVSVINTTDHRGPTTECETTVCSGNLTVRETIGREEVYFYTVLYSLCTL